METLHPDLTKITRGALAADIDQSGDPETVR